MLGLNRFTCPFCLNSYNKNEVNYVCPDCGQAVKKKPFMREPIKCTCGGFATKRGCPICGEIIPRTALETPNLPFSIVGVTGSGKTNFITVMMHELIHNDLSLAVASQTLMTSNHQQDMENRIYNSYLDKIDPPFSTAPDEVFPQIWYARNLQRGNRNEVPTYTFTIFDGAGESHEQVDVNAMGQNDRELRYIKASKAIIITIDPLVFSSVVRGGFVDPKVVFNSRAGEVAVKDAAAVINGVADYIKMARQIRTQKKLDIPVAVVLTKIDTVLSHPAFGVGNNSVIRRSSMNVRDGKVDFTEMLQVDRAIREWLYEIHEDSFINALEAQFKEYMLFGVSSLGAPPTGVTTFPKEIHPHRILDPILWLFKKEDFIS